MISGVSLRDVTEDDIPILFDQQLDPDATRMAAFPSREWEPFLAHWKKILADDTLIKQTILFGDQVAGNIGRFGPADELEIGYWLGKQYWGKGIATQALLIFLDRFPSLPLHAHVAKHNLASVRVLEKCGFKIVGEEEEFSSVHGENVPILTLILGDNAAQV